MAYRKITIETHTQEQYLRIIILIQIWVSVSWPIFLSQANMHKLFILNYNFWTLKLLLQYIFNWLPPFIKHSLPFTVTQVYAQAEGGAQPGYQKTTIHILNW